MRDAWAAVLEQIAVLTQKYPRKCHGSAEMRAEMIVGDPQTEMSNTSRIISYSEKYYDDKYEYRHVILPNEIAKNLPYERLMTETEWRNLGVQQSPGWVNYMIHSPERHILLFRRPITSHQDG